MLKEETLFCPLMFSNSQGSANCLKEVCAWWNKYTNECAVLQLSIELNCTIKDNK